MTEKVTAYGRIVVYLMKKWIGKGNKSDCIKLKSVQKRRKDTFSNSPINAMFYLISSAS